MARRKTNVGQQHFGFQDEDLKTPLHDEIVLWLKQNALEVSKKLLKWSESWNAEWVRELRSRFMSELEERKSALRRDLKAGVLWRHASEQNDLRWHEGTGKADRLRRMENYLSFLESCTGLGEPPARQIEVTSAWEVPIKRERYKSTDIVGYADIVFSISASHLHTPSLPVDNFGRPMLETCDLHWWTHIADPAVVALDAKTTIPSLGQLFRDLNTYRTWCSWPFVVVSPDARFAEAIADEGFGFIQYPAGTFLPPHPKER